MSKSIYDEVLDEIGYMIDACESEEYLKLLELVEQALEQAQKKEKLLELYRQLVLDLGVVIEIGDNGLVPLKTYKKIKELENEK